MYKKQFHVGVAGFGFVGKAVYHGFCDYCPVFVYDINESAIDKVKNDINKLPIKASALSQLAYISDVIFICVPTPTDIDTGKIDTSIVENTVGEILNTSKKPTIIIKSTVVPGTTNKLQQKYQMNKIVFNPEFLTEKNYIQDFKNQKYVVLGGSPTALELVHHLYASAFENISIYCTDASVAEMLKYMTNCMLAAKVGLCNEFKKVCDASNIDYSKVIALLRHDIRFGSSHFDVPGPDGQLGFGGKCFPKDLVAFINFAEENGVDAKVLSTIWEQNLINRKEYDWLDIPGALS